MSYANILDAMIGHLRSTPAVVAAFGDDASDPATSKFWPVPVRPEVQLPWAVFQDVAGNVQYMTRNADGKYSTIESSAIQWIVAADGKDVAASLVNLLVKTLNDAPLVFDSSLLMYFRAGSPSAVPTTGIAPNSPNVYAYGVTIDSMVQGTA